MVGMLVRSHDPRARFFDFLFSVAQPLRLCRCPLLQVGYACLHALCLQPKSMWSI